MDTHFWQISVFLHILAAIVWIGGSLFIVIALLPVLRKPENRSQLMPLLKQVGGRFRVVGWISLIVLLVTGFINLNFRKWMSLGESFWDSSLGHHLTTKLVLVLVVIGLSLAHDFFIGSAAVEAWEEDPGSDKAKRLRKATSWIGRINLGLAILIVALGVLLVRPG